jgi:hypothetical protein
MRIAGDNTRNDTARNAHVAPPADGFARRIRQVRTWALAHGEIASRDALQVICEVKAARRAPFDRWRLVDVDELVWHELMSWCQHQDMPLPTQLAETLWTYLGFLWDAGVADPASHQVEALRAPLIAYGGLGSDGRPRSDQRRRTSSPSRTPHRPEPQPVPPSSSPDERRGGLAPIIPLRPRRHHPSARPRTPSSAP